MKCLITLILIFPGILFSQQLPLYAPGQAIVIFDQATYLQIQDELLQESLQTSNSDVNQLFTSLEATRIHNILQKDKFDLVEENAGFNRTFVIYFPSFTDADIEAAVIELKNSYTVEDAFPNELGYELIEPNDPSFSSQSNLQRIKMPQAWDIQKGSSNIRLAIFDTGFQPTHREINSKIYLQKDFVDINFANYPNWTFFVNEGEDYHDIDDDATGLRTHGTEVAQVAAAFTDNGYGVAGVGWLTPIVIVRCGFQAIPPGGQLGGYINTSNFINALNWIRSSNSVNVINMSLGLSSSPNTLVQNAITACINAGIVVVASAGNTAGAPVLYPAAYPGVIAVSGVNSNDINSGWNVGPQLSVVAPANGVWMNFDGTTGFGTGSSLSAPLVAGAATLILSQNPNLTPWEVKKVIEASAFKVPNMYGQIFDNYYGYGLLDVYEALRALNSIYLFKNKISSNENYGDLVIDNDNDHPFSSNSNVPVKYEVNHVSRTDELPFLYDWNGTGTTQKFLKWYEGEDSDYNLSLQFTANTSTPPVKDANFISTEPVIVKNNFLDATSLDPSGDNILFKDPWFYYKDVNNNWFQSNTHISYSSPLDIQNNTANSYGGIFLDQSGPPSWPTPYYDVWALDQDINIPGIGVRKFYHQNWSATGGATIQTYSEGRGAKIVFTAPGATVMANLKGTQLSNDEDAYSNNSQRKIVRVEIPYSGIPPTLHSVYESNGYCWYEMSTDNGQTWEIMNDGKPLSFAGYCDEGKSPSIAYSRGQDVIYIVWQGKQPTQNYTKIMFASFMPNPPQSTEYVLQQLDIIAPELNYSYEVLDVNPVLAMGPGNWGVVVWKGTFNDNTLNLKYKLGWITDVFQTRSSGSVPQSDFNSLNPSISVHREYSWADVFHLAFQHLGKIYYYKMTRSGNQLNLDEFAEVSYNNGFGNNYNPSIIACIENNNSNPKVCWIAKRTAYSDDPLPLYETKVFFRSKDNGNWSAFNSYSSGSNINSVNINKNEDNSFAFAWSEGNRNINKFVRGNYLSTYYTTNTTGTDLQVGNFASLNSMRLNSFSTSTTPYSFSLSNTFSNNQHEEEVFADREGVIVEDTTAFYFSVGKISVDDEQIEFVKLPDTLIINNQEVLNTFLISEPFNLTDNTPFTYGVRFGVTDSLSAATILINGKSVNFKVELIDEQTNEILGTLDDVTFNELNIIPYENIAYLVNILGIGNKTCRLRLVTNDDLSFNYSLIDNFNNDTTLAKRGFIEKTLTLDGNEIVKSYALEQNFPNPFNPATTIKYQLPASGNVTLKIYDILGSVVKTLVNEEKVAGKYEVKFDASSFASGVYLYRLKVNDFVDTKKMLMIK